MQDTDAGHVSADSMPSAGWKPWLTDEVGSSRVCCVFTSLRRPDDGLAGSGPLI